MAKSQTARELKHWRVEYCNAGERKEEIVSGASADRGETGGTDMGLSSTTQFKFAVYDADGDVKEMYTHVERVSRVPSAGEA